MSVEVFNPFFQIEVRYTPILNFASYSHKVLAPYVKLSTKVSVDKENTLREAIQLIFEEDKYTIAATLDRIWLRGQGRLEEMVDEGSAMNQIFIPLLKDIKAIETFGKIENYLLLALTIMFKEKGAKEKLVSDFKDRFITKNAREILADISDIGIILEDRREEREDSITFGPYLGPEDLLKRSLKPTFEITEIDLDRIGQMLEIKLFRKGNKFDSDQFEELVSQYKEYYVKFK